MASATLAKFIGVISILVIKLELGSQLISSVTLSSYLLIKGFDLQMIEQVTSDQQK